MMKFYLYLAIIFAALFTSCKEEIFFEPLNNSEISGARLWERINVEGDYANYSYWPSHEGINPGQAPHGVYHKIFINKNLSEALPIESKTAPYGTIIVKENMSIEQKVVKITVMAKIEGFNPEVGDWYWAAYDPQGKVLAEGTPKGCVSCHKGMKNNDFIIVRPLDFPLQ